MEWGSGHEGVLANEPVLFVWQTESSLTGVIWRTNMGNLNGYVKLGPGLSRYHDAEDFPVAVHGGLTFCGELRVLYDQYPDANLSGLLVGFDCAHGGDLIPMLGSFGLPSFGGVYRDFEYVFKEVEHLAQQLVGLQR